jgi:transcriptional regulator with XRE-family HTH domain
LKGKCRKPMIALNVPSGETADARNHADGECIAPIEARAPFGHLLREFRLALNLSQEALAERAGLSTGGISALERGIRRAPHRVTIALLTSALDLSVCDRERLHAAAKRVSSPRKRRLPPANADNSNSPITGTQANRIAFPDGAWYVVFVRYEPGEPRIDHPFLFAREDAAPPAASLVDLTQQRSAPSPPASSECTACFRPFRRLQQ